METATFDPRKELLDRLTFARTLFAADVNATPADVLASTHGGESRCGFDFIYELTGFFDTFRNLLISGPSEIEGPKGWTRAPKDFHDKAVAMQGLEGAARKFADALENYQGDFISDVFPSPVGPFTPLGMGNLAVWHMMYHSGQLNYIQTIHGDAGFHWMPESK